MTGKSKNINNSQQLRIVGLTDYRFTCNLRFLVVAKLFATVLLLPLLSQAQFVKLSLDIEPVSEVYVSGAFLPVLQPDFETHSEAIEGTLVLTFNASDNLYLLVTRGDLNNPWPGQVTFAYRNDGLCQPVISDFETKVSFPLSQKGFTTVKNQLLPKQLAACLHIKVRLPLKSESTDNESNNVLVNIEFN